MEKEVQFLLDTLEIYSPSENEGELASFLLKEMRDELGFQKTRIDSAGNVIGEVGDGKTHVLLCGHMDTVPGELPVKIEGDRVFGRGAVDAKSALCAMLVAASRLKGKSLKVTVVGATREEGDSLGIETLIEAGGDYNFAILGEPAGASRVTVGYRGRIEMQVITSTSGGHAASPWAHPSAVEEALRLLERIRDYEKAHTQGENHFHSLSVALTLINGGNYSNVIPANCAMTLDVRVPVGMRCEAVMSDIKTIAEKYEKERTVVRVGLSFEKPTQPYESDSNSLIIRSFQRSIIKNLGEKPALTHKTGTGDMNTLAERMKIPCATYGPVDSRLAHTDREFVEVTDYLNSIKVLTGVFKELEGLATD
jgi:LysW-gamma-L-lysine carboxypeptidase